MPCSSPLPGATSGPLEVARGIKQPAYLAFPHTVGVSLAPRATFTVSAPHVGAQAQGGTGRIVPVPHSDNNKVVVRPVTFMRRVTAKKMMKAKEKEKEKERDGHPPPLEA